MSESEPTASPFDLSGPSPWRTIARREVFRNEYIRLAQDEVVQPDGERGYYTYVEVPNDVVAVVPLDRHNRVRLVRQWRYPWQRNSWEIPAGHCEPEEDHLAAAQRELAEEAGYVAARWELLGTGYGSAAVTARVFLYLARDLTPAPPSTLDPGEGDLIARDFEIDDAVHAALDGTIVHAFSIIGILRVARLLGR